MPEQRDFLCSLCMSKHIDDTNTDIQHPNTVNLFSLGKKRKSCNQSITIMTWTSARYDRHPRFLDEQKDQASVLPCDESLCVSGLGYLGCCADGYIPQKIGEESFYYFTCCPPMPSSYTYDNIERRCSDVIILSKNTEDDTNNTDKCVNASQPYLRPMKNSTSLSHESFLCCDSDIDNTTDFLNITFNLHCLVSHVQVLFFYRIVLVRIPLLCSVCIFSSCKENFYTHLPNRHHSLFILFVQFRFSVSFGYPQCASYISALAPTFKQGYCFFLCNLFFRPSWQ